MVKDVYQVGHMWCRTCVDGLTGLWHRTSSAPWPLSHAYIPWVPSNVISHVQSLTPDTVSFLAVPPSSPGPLEPLPTTCELAVVR